MISSNEVKIIGNNAEVRLTSDASNLKEYQMSELPAGEWHQVSEEMILKLKNKRHEYLFRAVNLADVPGPEHKIVIEKFHH